MRIFLPVTRALALVAFFGFQSLYPASAQSNSPAPSQQPAGSHPLTKEDLEAWLDGFFPYALQANDISGAVVVVVKDGKVLHQKGYGYSNIASRIPMDPELSIVGVGSVSKTFTWTAVMQLVAQGKIDLDRDVNEYLDFKIPLEFGKPITMRHLMTHTAGFAERIKTYHRPGTEARTLAQYFHQVPIPLRVYPPGQIPAYSNYGANLAGYIVERVSGEQFPHYIDRHILAPLNMQHSSFQVPLPKNLQAHVAVNYQIASTATPHPPGANDEEPLGEPAGGLMSTASDMSRYMLAHLQGGRFNDFEMLPEKFATLMHAPAFTPAPGASPINLGFFQNDYSNHRIISHDGDSSGFHTDMQLLLDDRVGFFTSVNSDGTGGLLPAGAIMRTALFHQFMDRYYPAPQAADLPTVPTAREHSKLIAGEYEMSRRPGPTFMKAVYLAVRISIKAHEDGTIETPAWLNFDGRAPQKWREVGPFFWQEVGGRSRLAMQMENGQIRLWLPPYVGGFVCEPVPFLWSGTLNIPLLIISASILVLATIFWPIAAVLRRRYARPLDLTGKEKSARRVSVIATSTTVLYLLSWILFLAATAGSFSGFNVRFDPWIRLIQFIGVLCVFGAAASIWSAWITCRSSQHWWSKATIVFLTLAMLNIVWFSFAFSLISATLNY